MGVVAILPEAEWREKCGEIQLRTHRVPRMNLE
jgi:hypothetical protein